MITTIHFWITINLFQNWTTTIMEPCCIFLWPYSKMSYFHPNLEENIQTKQNLPKMDENRSTITFHFWNRNIPHPIRMCYFKFSATQKVTMPLQSILLSQSLRQMLVYIISVFFGDAKLSSLISIVKNLLHSLLRFYSFETLYLTVPMLCWSNQLS